MNKEKANNKGKDLINFSSIKGETQMENLNLTPKELKTFEVITENGLNAMGGKKPSDLLYDNYSWFVPEDIKEKTDFSTYQIAGLISALEKKGLISKDIEKNPFTRKTEITWYLSDLGLTSAINLFETKV